MVIYILEEMWFFDISSFAAQPLDRLDRVGGAA